MYTQNGREIKFPFLLPFCYTVDGLGKPRPFFLSLSTERMSVCSSFSPLSLGGGGRDTKEAFFRPDEEGREGRGGEGPGMNIRTDRGTVS